MIHLIRHRGLRRLHEHGAAFKLPGDRGRKLLVILTLLAAATTPHDLN